MITAGSAQALLEVLIAAVVKGDADSVAKAEAGLAGLMGRDWIRVDEAARPWYAESPSVSIDQWRVLLAQDADVLAAIAGSMHRDGHIRQNAVEMLTSVPGPVAAAALAVRAGDWVRQVESAAWRALSTRNSPQDTAAIVSVLLVLNLRQRSRVKAARYLSNLADGPCERLTVLAADGDRHGRLWALTALHRRAALNDDQLATLAIRDPDPMIALWSARHLLTDEEGAPTRHGVRLLTSSRAVVRAYAVQRNKIAASAVKYLRRSTAVSPDLLRQLDQADTARSRQSALALRQSQGNWERVQADLEVLSRGDNDLAVQARADLISWLQHGAATSYTKPSSRQTAQLVALLPGSGLTEPQRRQIAFSAGLPPESS